MTLAHRVLHPEPIGSLADYVEHLGGGQAITVARTIGPDAIITTLEQSGLRGRGGAGFPTATKWRTVRDNRSPALAATVVVNGAEGEPGTFKDRTILRNNPYVVLEGALVAALAVDADEVIVALKRSFPAEVARVRAAIDELEVAGWTTDIEIVVFEGPDEYLYGEETALLETIGGRDPFPRIAPPFRRGVDEVVEADDVDSESGLSAHVEMAGASTELLAPPTLVNNVETLANVAPIVWRGPNWFRTEGTQESPGTVVCTITGQVQRAGIGEVIMGTTLREAIDEIAGGAREGHRLVALLSGVSGRIVPEALFDTPMTYEDMANIGSGLGSAGFIVLDETSDVVAAAAGVSRFLAVESCGQCTPCKQDGLQLSGLLGRLAHSAATEHDVELIGLRSSTVADGARCSIGRQQQAVVTGLLEDFGDVVTAHLDQTLDPAPPLVVAELVELRDGRATIDVHHADKQPDWTYNPEDSGQSPAQRFADHRADQPLDS